jgi:intein/homing endonuclease
MEVKHLKYPLKSHRKTVTLPKYSVSLAEFFGIMLGDGGINNDWQATITVNAISDADFAVYISKLCEKLFNVIPAIRKRKKTNALVISLASTSVVDFLVKNGLPRGNKLKNGLKIPNWILSKPSFQKACVRGLIDTDGCIYIHAHKVGSKEYRNIGLNFTDYEPKLIRQVAQIFKKFGIIPHITKRGYDIYLYKMSSIEKYLKIFGTSNQRISSIYKKWEQARN